MKILLTGDLQAQTKNIDKCEVILKFLLQCIPKYQIDAVGLLGDIKESFSPVAQPVTNWIISMGQRLVEVVPTFALEGNHDRVSIADGSETGLPVLAATGVTIIEHPALYSNCYCVPFFRDITKAEAAIEEGAKHAPILFFHNEVKGCQANINYKSPTGINPKLLAKYQICIGGHIHFQQQVNNNTWFVGAPFCDTWGEVNQQKGFLLLDTATYKVTSIPTPLPIWYDPMLPGFMPKTWNGVNVRITLQHDSKLAEVQQLAVAKSFPGAIFHYKNLHKLTTKNLDLEHTSDPELIHQFLKNNQLWPERCELEAYLEYKMADLGTGLRGLRGCKFLSVFGTNVLCFEKVKLELDKPGITLVTGQNKDWGNGRSNGSGKSSLLSLPLLLLFGRTPKGQESDGWARQQTKAKALLHGTIKLADGRTLGVFRERRPGSLQATLDGEPLGAGDARGVQKAIADYTGITWEVLNSSLYVGQAESSTLLQGTDKERKELFNQFLGLQRFQIAVERVTADVKKTKHCLGEIEQQGQFLLASLAPKRALVDQLEKMRLVHELQVKDQDSWKTQLTAHEKQLATLVTTTKPVLNDQAASRKIHLQRIQEVATWEERLRALKTSLHSATTNRICPACKRPLPKGDNQSVKHLAKEILVAEKALNGCKKQYQESTKAQVTFERVIQNQIERQSNLRQLIASLRGKIQQAENSSYDPELLAKTKNQLIQYERQTKHVAGYIEYLREHLEFLGAALQVVGRNGLPAFLCTLVCPQLNEAADEFSNAFAEAGIRVVFSGLEGEVDVQVENPHGGTGIEDQSAGEMRLAALITSFAMRSVLAPFGLLILDEPSEGMDPVNAAIFAKGLGEVSQRFGSVFVVSHNTNILENLDYQHHLELAKENRITAVREL